LQPFQSQQRGAQGAYVLAIVGHFDFRFQALFQGSNHAALRRYTADKHRIAGRVPAFRFVSVRLPLTGDPPPNLYSFHQKCRAIRK